MSQCSIVLLRLLLDPFWINLHWGFGVFGWGVVLVVGVVLSMDEMGQMPGMVGCYNCVGSGAHPDHGKHR